MGVTNGSSENPPDNRAVEGPPPPAQKAPSLRFLTGDGGEAELAVKSMLVKQVHLRVSFYPLAHGAGAFWLNAVRSKSLTLCPGRWCHELTWTERVLGWRCLRGQCLTKP